MCSLAVFAFSVFFCFAYRNSMIIIKWFCSTFVHSCRLCAHLWLVDKIRLASFLNIERPFCGQARLFSWRVSFFQQEKPNGFCWWNIVIVSNFIFGRSRWSMGRDFEQLAFYLLVVGEWLTLWVLGINLCNAQMRIMTRDFRVIHTAPYLWLGVIGHSLCTFARVTTSQSLLRLARSNIEAEDWSQ